MSKAQRVLGQRLERELMKLPVGTWVAMTQRRIIATGDTPTAVYEAAQAAGVEVPILYQIPDPNTHWYFGTVAA
jgi:hypothetical protein